MSDRSSVNMDRVGIGLVIYLIIISLFFFIAERTLLFVLCYIFALTGGILFAVSLMILAGKQSKLPQDLVFPIIAKSYMVFNILVSIVFLLLEQQFDQKIKIIYPILIHVVLLSVFIWRVLALHAGKEHMEEVNKKSSRSVNFQRKKLVVLSDCSAGVTLWKNAAEKSAAQKVIGKVKDALRYSDPVVPEELAEYDQQISEVIMELKEAVDNADAPEVKNICDSLLVMLEQRKQRIKVLKRS